MIGNAFEGALGLSFIFIFIMLFLLLLFMGGTALLITGLLLNKIKTFKKTPGSRSVRKIFIIVGTALSVPLPLVFSAFFIFSFYKETETRQEMGDLVYAMEHDLSPMFKRMLRKDKPVNEEFVHYGSTTTPLIYACNKGAYDYVQLLLESGADPEIELSDSGINPLWAAITANNPEIVELLIESGADAGWDRDGESLLHTAYSFGNDAEIFSLLLEGGADTDSQSEYQDGQTVLMTLFSECSSDNEDVSRERTFILAALFSEYDADIYHLRDNSGKTAWDYVLEHPECDLEEDIRILFPDEK